MITAVPGAPGRQISDENSNMADPKCPDCGKSGIENIVSTPSKEQSRERRAWFYVAHCDNCGHVFGIFTKHVYGKSGPQLIVEGRK